LFSFFFTNFILVRIHHFSFEKVCLFLSPTRKQVVHQEVHIAPQEEMSISTSEFINTNKH